MMKNLADFDDMFQRYDPKRPGKLELRAACVNTHISGDGLTDGRRLSVRNHPSLQIRAVKTSKQILMLHLPLLRSHDKQKMI